MAPAPEAVYDSLFIANKLEIVSGGAADSEISNFAYLACLLSVYKGHPPSEWGYRFAATSSAAPFSPDLADAVEALLMAGLLVDSQEGVKATPTGRGELAGMGALRRLLWRSQYLEAACGSALALPLPLVGESLAKEPQLRSALALSSSRPLLDEAGSRAIISHFAVLADAVPDASSLLVPAVVWLGFLSRSIDQRTTVAEVEY